MNDEADCDGQVESMQLQLGEPKRGTFLATAAASSAKHNNQQSEYSFHTVIGVVLAEISSSTAEKPSLVSVRPSNQSHSVANKTSTRSDVAPHLEAHKELTHSAIHLAKSKPSHQATSQAKSRRRMLRFVRSPAFQRQLATRGIATSRTLFMALQTRAPLTSLNAQAMTHLDMHETLEEVAASHFSESSAFPEFSPKEDVLLGQAIPLIKDVMPIMDAHALAAEELNAEMQQHFCESSDFPEYTPAEEEAMILKEM